MNANIIRHVFIAATLIAALEVHAASAAEDNVIELKNFHFMPVSMSASRSRT